MALASITTTDEKTLQVEPSSVVAIEELGSAFCRLYLSGGAAFNIKGSATATATALGL
jgi:hypothetical protein